MKIEITANGTAWVWWWTLDKRNGYWAFGPVGQPFNRRKLRHWLVAAIALWRRGKR